MRDECPPPTPPASPTASVFNLAPLAANIPSTCPGTCNCPKICELTTDTDDPPAATTTATTTTTTTTTYPNADDEVVSQILNPEAQDFTPKASGPHEPILSLLLPASIENKASCSRGPRNCCKTSEAAPCNAAKLEKLHLNKKAIQAAAVTCCDLRTPTAFCETIVSCVKKDTPCYGCLQDVEDVTGPTYTSPESGSV